MGASTPIVDELRRLTSTIPLVFTQVGDPIDSGLVTNLAQPGGNITGFSAFEPDMGGKWLGVLKEAAPQRGRRVSQLSKTLAASVAKKRKRLEKLKGLTRYGKRHPRIQPKNTPRGPLKNGSKNRTQAPVPAARVYGSDPEVCMSDPVRVQGGVPAPPCDPPPSPCPPRCDPSPSDGGPANPGFWSAAPGPGFWFGCCCWPGFCPPPPC